MYDLAGSANRYHPGTDTALSSKDRNLGAVGLRSLKKSLDEEDDDRVQGKESSLGKRRSSSRAFNSVRAIAEPEIALLEDLAAQASEGEEEEEKADTSDGKSVAAFANVPASTPGTHGTPYV